MKKKTIWLVASCLIVAALLLSSCAPATIAFPDEKLGVAIRDALGKPPGEDITAAELARVVVLRASKRDITDLSGIERCVNLTVLRIEANQISDLTPLSSLTNLTKLWLFINQISDLSPLASLTNLTKLWLFINQISDLSPLASLTNLTELDIHGNQISDLSPLITNTGLDLGDDVYLKDNKLDLSEGSKDLEDIRQLEARGVRVSYKFPNLN